MKNMVANTHIRTISWSRGCQRWTLCASPNRWNTREQCSITWAWLVNSQKGCFCKHTGRLCPRTSLDVIVIPLSEGPISSPRCYFLPLYISLRYLSRSPVSQGFLRHLKADLGHHCHWFNEILVCARAVTAVHQRWGLPCAAYRQLLEKSADQWREKRGVSLLGPGPTSFAALNAVSVLSREK